MRKVLIFFAALLLISGLSGKLMAEEKIVAIVNKEIITQRDLESFLNFMKVQLSRQYSSRELEERIAVMRSDLLDRLIEDRLILQEAKKTGFKIDESRVKAKLDELKKRYDSPSDFENALKNQGLVEADLEDKIRDQILMYHIVETRIRSKIMIKPSEITEYYNKNSADYSIPEEREFQSFSGSDEAAALKVVEGLRAGKEIAEIARDSGFSPNIFSARKGGELKDELEEQIFKLAVGEVSEPIKIKDSYYVFKLNRIKPARQQGLSEVQDSIQAILYEQKMQAAMTKWIEELKKKAYIKRT